MHEIRQTHAAIATIPTTYPPGNQTLGARLSHVRIGVGQEVIGHLGQE